MAADTGAAAKIVRTVKNPVNTLASYAPLSVAIGGWLVYCGLKNVHPFKVPVDWLRKSAGGTPVFGEVPIGSGTDTVVEVQPINPPVATVPDTTPVGYEPQPAKEVGSGFGEVYPSSRKIFQV